MPRTTPPEKLRAIKAMLEAGESVNAICKELHVGFGTVMRVRDSGALMVHVSTVDPAIGADPEDAVPEGDEGGSNGSDSQAEVAELKALVEELRNHIVEQSIEFLRCLRVIRQQQEG